MKAWQIRQHGGLEALQLLDLPDPVPAAGQARIRVASVGLNHLDLWVRKGVPGHKFPLPLIPGCDISGVVESFGPVSTQQKEALKKIGIDVGSSVIVSPGVSCEVCEACLAGQDFLCKHYGILGETTNGGCAEFVVVPIANLIARPKNLSAVQAAAIQIPFLTAWNMVHRKAKVQPGELVLIQAGGSGVSVAAIQMCKMVGATVITTVGSPEKAAKAQALGADFVINYKDHKGTKNTEASPGGTPIAGTPSFSDEVKKISQSLGKRGCEVVIDHVGTDTLSGSMKCMAWGGRLAICGATSGSDFQVDLKQVFFKNLSILGTTMGSKADLIQVVRLLEQGKLKPIVDSEFAMADLPKAHARLESRQAFGKVICSFSHI
jgi:NADPH:quinone reductase-like Zn-dependent oxidoreductase